MFFTHFSNRNCFYFLNLLSFQLRTLVRSTIFPLYDDDYSKKLIKPQFHIGEFPNGHIVWPAIKYDPKKADMEVPAENPPKFGPDFGQERNGVDDKKYLFITIYQSTST